jgi:hypothetical protein
MAKNLIFHKMMDFVDAEYSMVPVGTIGNKYT